LCSFIIKTFVNLQPRVDSAIQDQLNAAQEELEEATQKLEKSDKKISRLEEALDIKDEEILTLRKYALKSSFYL